MNEIFQLSKENTATRQVLMIMQDLDTMDKSVRESKLRDQIGYGRPHVIRLFNLSIDEISNQEEKKYMESLKDKYLRVYLNHLPMYFNVNELDIKL